MAAAVGVNSTACPISEWQDQARVYHCTYRCDCFCRRKTSRETQIWPGLKRSGSCLEHRTPSNLCVNLRRLSSNNPSSTCEVAHHEQPAYPDLTSPIPQEDCREKGVLEVGEMRRKYSWSI